MGKDLVDSAACHDIAAQYGYCQKVHDSLHDFSIIRSPERGHEIAVHNDLVLVACASCVQFLS